MRSLSRQIEGDEFIQSSLMGILKDVNEISHERLRNKGIDFQIEKIDDITFDCHPGQVGQALLNLINNSVDALENLQQKWIKIGAHRTKTHVEIRVIDSGQGIEESIRNKIMNPFFTTKDIGKGTGLGLSLVQNIIRAHHGEFFLNTNSPNTEFILKFPLSQNLKSVSDS